MSEPRNREQIIAATREMLDHARLGLKDAIGPEPKRRRSGLMNLFTYGRSVTMAIQTMKSLDPSFPEWWAPYQERMRADPLMKFFNHTRSEILHEGRLDTMNVVAIGAVDMGVLQSEFKKREPPNAVGTFIGDQVGGSGWEVRMPDGSLEKVYAEIPAEIDIQASIELIEPPREHDGQPITDTSIANLGQLFVEALAAIVEDFVARYGDGISPAEG